MFCSKCGKEISDDAVFCDKCGASTSNNSSSGGTVAIVKPVQISETERRKKMAAVYSFAVYMGLVISFFVLLFFFDIGIIFDGSISGVIEEWSGFFGVLILLLFGAYIAEAVVLYRIPLKNRTFDDNKAKLKNFAITNILYPFILIPIFIMWNKEYGVAPSGAVYLAFAINIAANIIIIITYNKAAEEESNSKYREAHSTSRILEKISNAGSAPKEIPAEWTCRNCGRVNKAIDSYCKDCGKYK